MPSHDALFRTHDRKSVAPRWWLFSLLVVLGTPSAAALDRQGSAHGGATDPSTEGRNLSGALQLGIAPYNPSYAARPDNSGLALFRYGAHFDVDLIGSRLSIPIDVNFFTDAQRPGVGKILPSEFDVIAGLTSTWRVWHFALEGGLRVENDAPADRTGYTQTYTDARVRLLYSLADIFPRFGRALGVGDLSGWVTLGWFAQNPSYAARPDNTGNALFRYAFHTELSVWHDRISLGADFTFFTDRRSAVVVRPSELDFTIDLIGHLPPFELHVAFERDMPVDMGGLTQSFLYVLGVWSFDVGGNPTMPLAARTPVASP